MIEIRRIMDGWLICERKTQLPSCDLLAAFAMSTDYTRTLHPAILVRDWCKYP